MARQTVPDMKELFRQAAEIAQQVPESMQEAAFNRALDLLVGDSSPTGTVDTVPPKLKTAVARKPQQGAAESDGNLLQHIDSTQHPGVRSTTKVLDRSLMVLQIALRDHSVDGLTPTEISRILTEKFRIGTTREAVGMALKGASNLVDRVPEGRGYRYRIMGPGENYLTHLGDDQDAAEPNQSSSTPKKRGKTKRAPSESAQASKTSEPAKSDSATKAKAKRTTSAKLGPKAAITGLIESGFFAEPKTGPEVQAYLKKKQGFNLGTDQLRLAMLRLVRDEVMERDENDEGQYEYKRP